MSGAPAALRLPKSDAWSLTLTPTFQIKTWFVRGELSYTKIESGAPIPLPRAGRAAGADCA